MTLYYCPACGAFNYRKYSCVNNSCGAFLMLTCIKEYKDSLANIREELILEFDAIR